MTSAYGLQPAVFLQAAGDSQMTLIGQILAMKQSGYGATGTVPLLQMKTGLCLPHETAIYMTGADPAGATNGTIPNGQYLQASGTQGTGGSSYLNGTDFYLRKSDGSALDASIGSNNIGEGGFIFHFLEDDDPRKVYGLPYTFITHEKHHQNSWIANDQPGRSSAYANSVGDKNPKQRFNYRTKWDFIGPSERGSGGASSGVQSSTLEPGFAFGDTSDRFRTRKSRILAIERSGIYSRIETEGEHFIEIGDFFRARNINTTSMANLHSNLQSLADDTIYRCISVQSKSTFTAYVSGGTSGGQAYTAFPLQNQGTPAVARNGHDALIFVEGKASHAVAYMNTPTRMPTTTAFRLNVTDIQHTFSDQTSISPMPKGDITGKIYEQVQNIGLSLGMRKEVMKLSGTLVDTGPVSATNIRKQVLMNIARTQWLKIAGYWGGKPRNTLDGKKGYQHSGNNDRKDWRGWGYGGPQNPRSYPCITIYEPRYQNTSSDYIDTNTDGSYNIFRGIITSISMTQQAGRVDIWDWSLDFAVVHNEKAAASVFNTEE